MIKNSRRIQKISKKQTKVIITHSEGETDVELQPYSNELSQENDLTRYSRRRVTEGIENAGKKQKSIWKTNEKLVDTSGLFSRHYINNKLWTRICSNSGGSLPKEIRRLSDGEILEQDGETIRTYCDNSRRWRKCIWTVVCACAKYSAECIGCFQINESRGYDCRPISESVLSLSKNTHAGSDTFGRKNDLKVQQRIIDQITDLFRKPNSHKIFQKNLCYFDEKLENMFKLYEIIFHRFQALYDKNLDYCVEKCRIVWCVPFTIVALENIFFGNIIENVKNFSLIRNETMYPIGMTNFEIGKKSVATLRERFKFVGNKDFKIYSLDFSKYDASIPSHSKDIFFALMKGVINLSKTQEKVYDFLRVYIKFTPFSYKGKILYKQKGISSGLLITNFFDTWWNLTIHYFVQVLYDLYYDSIDDIMTDNFSLSTSYMDVNKVKYEPLITRPLVRVMGDDSIILCTEHNLKLHRKVCELFGMKVTIKHVTEDVHDDIFFLGRYWNSVNRPFQTEEYIALRIVYCRWYNKNKLPFSIDKLHIYRILSICLPLVNGKEFLDKYLFDYPLYVDFKESKDGFIYMKDFIENQFKIVPNDEMYDIDRY
jgi:hypothetical protein